MNITMTMQVTYDHNKEDLREFKKKLDNFKEHISHMQLAGSLPRGEVTYNITSERRKVLGFLPPCAGSDMLNVHNHIPRRVNMTVLPGLEES